MTSDAAFTIPRLTDYSPSQLAHAASWPAIARYLDIIERPAQSPGDALRRSRHEAWLRAAIATFFGSPQDPAIAKNVCGFWSETADQLLTDAWKLSGCEKAGLGLLALGKLGAKELNLSSDVDLILVRPDHVDPDMKAFRDFQTLLSEATSFGFCLRTDFLLRPGGRASAAIPSLADFEYHYGYHGEMWERLAYVRMRVLQGPSALADSITRFATKFSYRRHLDYTLIDELKHLRARIRSEKAETRPDHFHLKLGEGGIRELELFVHALQVMHGGRNARLRTNSTTEAIEQIEANGLLPAGDCARLKNAYWYLRTLENRLQGYEDQQTYSVDLKNGHPALPFNFDVDLARIRKDVQEICGSFFTDGPSTASIISVSGSEWLEGLGFSRESRQETWPALISATALSRRSEIDELQRLEFLEGFVTKLATIKLDKDLGLSLLLDFVKAIRAKASFFTLLNREVRVRDDLARLFSISPYLGSLLSSRPELIDEFILRKQAEPSDDLGSLLEELAERRLLSELIAANHFLGDHDLRKMSLNLTANADAICTQLLSALKKEYGDSDLGLVALGKWGGRELGLRSDLDFVFVTTQTPNANDQKIAKRFLARITEAHRGGSIYSVDMRLRPSGNSGPIIVSQADLESYLLKTAAAWERQAYLRARALCELPFHPATIGAGRGLNDADLDELRMIRGKLFSSSSVEGIDLKLSYGGLADVEFGAQIALLARGEFSLDPSTAGMIQYLETVDPNWRRVGPSLRDSYQSLRVIEQLYQLTTSQSGSKMRVKSDEFKRLALVLGLSPDELNARIQAGFESISRGLLEVNVLDRT